MLRAFSKARNHRGFTLLELLVVASIIAIIAAIAIPQLLNAKRSAWESRCKTTLRAYGETQLAYQNTNNDHHWGSWDALKLTEYLASGYNRSNIVENYSVWTKVVNPSDMTSTSGLGGTGVGDNTFTVIAFPRTTSPPGYLSTFIIREDQVLRVYRPETGVEWGLGGDFGGMTWEPIR